MPNAASHVLAGFRGLDPGGAVFFQGLFNLPRQQRFVSRIQRATEEDFFWSARNYWV
jgi:hypothetical protein